MRFTGVCVCVREVTKQLYSHTIGVCVCVC